MKGHWNKPKERTHCNQGHEMSGDNLKVQKSTGYTYCGECNREHSRKNLEKRRKKKQAELNWF